MHEDSEKNYWETVQKSGQVKRNHLHPVIEYYCKQRINYLKKHLDFDLINNALDVGAGSGFASYYFPDSISIIDLDFSFRLLKINPTENRIQSSAFSLPFASNSFDLVYGWNILHHLDKPEDAVKEMARVTKNFLVLFEPNRNNPIQFLFGLYNNHERGTLQFNRSKLLELMNKIHFELISCETVGWFFAGPTPTFTLGLFKKLPFVHRLGISNVLICKKKMYFKK